MVLNLFLSTPLASSALLSATNGTPLNDPILYRQMVESMQYMTLSHPDIAFGINMVCEFMQSPRDTHLIVAK